MNDNFTREEDKLIRELGEQNLQFKREVEKRNYIIRKQQEELMTREILIGKIEDRLPNKKPNWLWYVFTAISVLKEIAKLIRDFRESLQKSRGEE
jgi:hypothetical protein